MHKVATLTCLSKVLITIMAGVGAQAAYAVRPAPSRTTYVLP